MEGDVRHSLTLDREAISIHSLRMEGDRMPAAVPVDLYISIHSLRMEGDQHFFGNKEVFL